MKRRINHLNYLLMAGMLSAPMVSSSMASEDDQKPAADPHFQTSADLRNLLPDLARDEIALIIRNSLDSNGILDGDLFNSRIADILDPQRENEAGETPFILSILEGNIEWARFLVSVGADPDLLPNDHRDSDLITWASTLELSSEGFRYLAQLHAQRQTGESAASGVARMPSANVEEAEDIYFANALLNMRAPFLDLSRDTEDLDDSIEGQGQTQSTPTKRSRKSRAEKPAKKRKTRQPKTSRRIEELKKYSRHHNPQTRAGAQYLLAGAYWFGLGGVTQDREQAVTYARRAAEDGHSHDRGRAGAQYLLALAYWDGLGGVTQDREQAVTYARRAAEDGHSYDWARAGAQYLLARACWNGEGVTQDREQALTYARRAAEGGHSNDRVRAEAQRLLRKWLHSNK